MRPFVSEADVAAWHCDLCDEWGAGYELPDWPRRGRHVCGEVVEVFVAARLASEVSGRTVA